MSDPTNTPSQIKVSQHGTISEGNADGSQHRDLLEKCSSLLKELSAIRLQIEDACIDNSILLDSLHMVCPLEESDMN